MRSIEEHHKLIKISGTVSGMSEGLLINRSPGSDLVVLLHSTGNDKFYPWAALIQLLIKNGFQILIFDLPGHGEGSTDLLTNRAYLCVKHALKEIQKETSWTRAFGIGQSLGGVVLLRAASEKDLNFSKLSVWGLPDGESLSVCAATELLSVFFPSCWQLVGAYGMFGALPALGRFKRKSYPVRLASGGYVIEVLAIIRSFIADLEIAHLPPTQIVAASIDYISNRKFVRNFAIKLKYSRLDWVQGTHFSLLCSKTAARKTIEWFLE